MQNWKIYREDYQVTYVKSPKVNESCLNNKNIKLQQKKSKYVLKKITAISQLSWLFRIDMVLKTGFTNNNLAKIKDVGQSSKKFQKRTILGSNYSA